MNSPSLARTGQPSLALASWALRVQFFVSGALFATWGVHVPTAKAHYGLGEQALAIAMLASGVGALIALTQAGRIIGRHGPRAVTAVTGAACSACIASLIAFPSYAFLLVLMLVYGICASLMDVSINAEASEIELQSGRAQMSGFHAMFSLGGMAGAAVGSVLPAAGVAPAMHLLGAGLVCVALIWTGCAGMLRMEGAAPGGGGLSLPHGVLLLVGTLAALGLVAEGAMYDWSVLFMKQERHSDPAVSAWAYACFSGAMARAASPATGCVRMSRRSC
jgi:MFS family permease